MSPLALEISLPPSSDPDPEAPLPPELHARLREKMAEVRRTAPDFFAACDPSEVPSPP